MLLHRLLWTAVAFAPLAWANPEDASAPLHTLPGSVSRILAAHRMPPSSFSAYVQEVGTERPLLAVNPDVARNPASTIKLLTTFVALDDLGPAYRWQTESYLGGTLHDGQLDGDLYLKGYGDPYLVTERFWLFLRDMRQRGLRDIRGDLIIDNSYFEIDPMDPGAFDGQAFRTYNVLPDALLVNFKAINFVFRPDPTTNRVEIIADPKPANLDIRNQMRLAERRCGGYQGGITIVVGESPDYDEVTFSGSFGRHCPEYRLSRSALRAPTYAYGLFSSLWAEGGGSLQGGLRIETVPEDLEPFVALESPSLAEVIRSVNKWSNNVMTRQILLTLGAEHFGPPATVENGRAAVTWYLAQQGLDFPELQLDNGAGLSRDTRISARNMGRLLLAASDSIYRAEFVASMALAGLDGTMRRRFRNESLTGRMHIKTGRLDGVFAMAGYLISESGREYVVVAIQNHADAHRGPGEEVQIALLRWVYRQ